MEVKKIYLEREGKRCGICGEEADFTDTLGNQLYVGDMVVIVSTMFKPVLSKNLCCIVKDAKTGNYEVMGLYGEAKKGFKNNPNWKIYRAIPYTEIPEGFRNDCHTYKKEARKMTVAEICKKLGYDIEIVKE